MTKVDRAGLILDIGEGSAPNLRHFPGCRRVPGTCQSDFREDFFFFIFSIVFNTFIKKGKNEYIFKENPKKKVGALLKICNLRYYRSFLTEKWLCNNQKCKKKSLFLSHKLTCFQLEMPQKINISSKKTHKNKNGDALKIYNLRYYRSFLTEKWLCYNQKCKNCQKY